MDPIMTYHLGRVQYEAIQEALKELHREPPVWEPLRAAIAAFARRTFSRLPARLVQTTPQIFNSENC